MVLWDLVAVLLRDEDAVQHEVGVLLYCHEVNLLLAVCSPLQFPECLRECRGG